MTAADLEAFPLCRYFLSGYLENCGDATNFPPNEGPRVFERYGEVFRSGLGTLKLEKEALRRRSEFNFDRATPANLESAIGVLRAVSALRMEHFSAITLLDPPGADLKCERDGRIVCCEVKTITKQSKPRKQGSFFTHHPYEIPADQLYEKIVEEIEHARNQLKLTAAQRHDVRLRMQLVRSGGLSHAGRVPVHRESSGKGQTGRRRRVSRVPEKHRCGVLRPKGRNTVLVRQRCSASIRFRRRHTANGGI